MKNERIGWSVFFKDAFNEIKDFFLYKVKHCVGNIRYERYGSDFKKSPIGSAGVIKKEDENGSGS